MTKRVTRKKLTVDQKELIASIFPYLTPKEISEIVRIFKRATRRIKLDQ